jgi:integrase
MSTTTRENRGGIQPRGRDRHGVEVWQLRGQVDGIGFAERFHGSRTDAKRRHRELMRDAERGTLAKGGGETVEDFFAAYLTHRVALGKLRSGKPLATHRGVVRTWIVPSLPRKLADVRAAHLQKVVHAMIEKERVRSTPQVRALVTGAFRWALATRRLAVNPAECVEWPEVRRLEPPALHASTIAKILEKADEEYVLPLSIAAATGLRASELAALRWANVMLDVPADGCPLRGKETDHPTFPHLHVTESLQRVDNRLTRQPPKSARGTRWVPLAPSTVTMLRAHRKEQVERRMSLGPAWTDEDAVIEDATGRPLDPDDFGRAFRRAASRAKVEGFRLHDLRHAYITSLVSNRIDPATVSRIAGHATVAFTLDRYYHPGATEAEGVAAAVESTISRVALRPN